MKNRLLLCLSAASAFVAPLSGHAQTGAAHYPQKPLHLIVPYPAGGGADHWARLVADQLAIKLGQPIIIDNIAGAGGNLGTAAAAHAPADGYTLLLGSVGPQAVHQFTYEALDFNPAKDFAPIALLESTPIVLVSSTTVPADSAKALIDLARAQPAALSYGSNGNGSPEQVAGEIFKRRLQVQIRHVPYRGAGPARKALVAHDVSMMFDPSKGALPAVRQGLQKMLAVAAPTRLSGAPDVPTFAEIGVPHYDLRIWTGIMAPAGTPQPIIARLNRAVIAVLRMPKIQQEIADEQGVAGHTTPAEFRAYIAAERRHWAALVTEAQIPKIAKAP